MRRTNSPTRFANATTALAQCATLPNATQPALTSLSTQAPGTLAARSPHRGSLAHSRLVPVALLTAALLVAVSSATAQAADVKPSTSARSNGAERYAIAPLADCWPGTTLDGACVKVRNDGSFTIKAEFRKVGAFYCGVSMGPCRSSADECGNGDPGLVGPIAVRRRTTL